MLFISCTAFRLYMRSACPPFSVDCLYRSLSLLESCFGRACSRSSCKFDPVLSLLSVLSGPCPTPYITGLRSLLIRSLHILYPSLLDISFATPTSDPCTFTASPRPPRIFICHISGFLWLRRLTVRLHVHNRSCRSFGQLSISQSGLEPVIRGRIVYRYRPRVYWVCSVIRLKWNLDRVNRLRAS